MNNKDKNRSKIYLSKNFNIFRLGSNPDTLFSYEMIQEHFRKYAKYDLVLSAALLPMIISDKGNKVDLGELAGNMEKSKENNYEDSKDFDVFDSFFFRQLTQKIQQTHERRCN